MEIDRKIFEKYSKIKKFNKDIDLSINPDNMYILSDNFINELVKQQAKDLDNMYCEFLEENGYKIDKPYNMEQLKEIKNDLIKKDKFVDYLEYTEFADNCTQAYHYIIPFFNSISNPLSEEARNKIIEEWKKKNDTKTV